ncbi:hypothetical protein M0Q50_04350 [bacterium]|jgi:hypothetical protein|nr:hypothetical protein [bacterium]
MYKNELVDLINKGWDINFWNQPKRLDDGFQVRVCWKAEYKNKKYDCEWEGFVDAIDCYKDFIKFTNNLQC